MFTDKHSVNVVLNWFKYGEICTQKGRILWLIKSRANSIATDLYAYNNVDVDMKRSKSFVTHWANNVNTQFSSLEGLQKTFSKLEKERVQKLWIYSKTSLNSSVSKSLSAFQCLLKIFSRIDNHLKPIWWFTFWRTRVISSVWFLLHTLAHKAD